MFASKEEASALILSRFPAPMYEIVTHHSLNGPIMMQLQSGSGRRFPITFAERIAISEVVELLRVNDATAMAIESSSHDAVTFVVNVAKVDLPRPRAVFVVLAAALVLLDQHVRARSESFTTFIYDEAEGTTSFSLMMDVERPTIQMQVYALEAYLEHYGVEGARVVIAEIRRRPPFTRYASTRVTVTVPTDANGVIKYNRDTTDLQEIA